jgi:hypothetical protein
MPELSIVSGLGVRTRENIGGRLGVLLMSICGLKNDEGNQRDSCHLFDTQAPLLYTIEGLGDGERIRVAD